MDLASQCLRSIIRLKKVYLRPLSGFQKTKDKAGFEILTVKAWDYPELLNTYKKAAEISRTKHIPCLIHVQEVTQPQGHSTSGSHERYKSKDRLDWEKSHDCILKMREWMIQEKMISSEELDQLEKNAKLAAKQARDLAWKEYISDIKKDVDEALGLIDKAGISTSRSEEIAKMTNDLRKELNPEKSHVIKVAKKALRLMKNDHSNEKTALVNWLKGKEHFYAEQFNSKLYSESPESALKVDTNPAVYSEESELVDGREVLNVCFDHLLKTDPRVFAFGEDVGKIGDVNQGFAGLQEKYGELKVTDTGIRETTIIGQGIGAAIRGLKTHS